MRWPTGLCVSSVSARVSRCQVTCTVVSVMPYILTSCGASSAWR
ncbi:hypothetical protein EJP617_D040 (plasmid) [Erwinia sp. Ejp617]|nr:hypothetical protein EJP617_C120 [Erwinia sp. Ejp617]ADP13341.1 hypothetical protein EJP617_D040 [Erwinia sp. Ejp617]